MLNELYDRPLIPTPMIIKVELKIHVENIKGILEPKEEERRERKKRKNRSIEKEAMKKAKKHSLQSENDWQVGVLEIQAGTNSSKVLTNDVDRVFNKAPTTDVLLSTPAITGTSIVKIIPAADGTLVDDIGTRSEGPHNDAT